MSDERKGVADPWKRGQPTDETEAKKTGAGLPGSDHALDWDILPDVSFTLRVPGAYGGLTIHGAQSMVGAATLLLRFVEGSEWLRNVLRGSNFRYSNNTERELPSGYMIYTPERDKVLYNPGISGESPNHVLRQGFSLLVKTLLRSCREDPKFRAHLKTLGIVPLLS